MPTSYVKGQPRGNHLGNGYNDFEMESGINTKVRCITAFVVISLIVATAGLVLAILLFLQVFDNKELEVSQIESLQERISQLERELDLKHHPQNFHLNLTKEDNDPETIPVEETGPRVDEAYNINSVTVPSIHAGVIPEEELSDLEKSKDLDTDLKDLDPPVEEPQRTPQDDDEDHEGSGGCPLYPRPICPVGYGVHEEGSPCPRPVCRKRRENP